MPETTITWLNPDGSGGALDDAHRALTVPGTVPGDHVRWRELRVQKRRVVGELEAILTPSADRRTPSCPWDADCGGCDLSAFAPGARTAALAGVVARTLRLDDPPEVVPSPRATGHRARVKLSLMDGKAGYRAARSHDLVEIGHCAVARPEIGDAIAVLRTWLADGHEGLTEVELRSDGTRVVYAFGSQGKVPRDTRERLATLGDVAVDGRTLYGDPVLVLDVLGLPLRVGPRAFYQVNLELNVQLVAYVRDQVLAAAPERVIDLYSGIGNLGLPIAAAGVPVLAVERDGQALGDLRETAVQLGLTQIRALAVDAAKFDPSREAFDVVVLDPPRAGSGEVLSRVLRNRPRRVVYVACNIVAVRPEIQRAIKEGYRVSAVRCFDLFPDTHHLEAVITLDRV